MADTLISDFATPEEDMRTGTGPESVEELRQEGRDAEDAYNKQKKELAEESTRIPESTEPSTIAQVAKFGVGTVGKYFTSEFSPLRIGADLIAQNRNLASVVIGGDVPVDLMGPTELKENLLTNMYSMGTKVFGRHGLTVGEQITPQHINAVNQGVSSIASSTLGVGNPVDKKFQEAHEWFQKVQGTNILANTVADFTSDIVRFTPGMKAAGKSFDYLFSSAGGTKVLESLSKIGVGGTVAGKITESFLNAPQLAKAGMAKVLSKIPFISEKGATKLTTALTRGTIGGLGWGVYEAGLKNLYHASTGTPYENPVNQLADVGKSILWGAGLDGGLNLVGMAASRVGKGIVSEVKRARVEYKQALKDELEAKKQPHYQKLVKKLEAIKKSKIAKVGEEEASKITKTHEALKAYYGTEGKRLQDIQAEIEGDRVSRGKELFNITLATDQDMANMVNMHTEAAVGTDVDNVLGYLQSMTSKNLKNVPLEQIQGMHVARTELAEKAITDRVEVDELFKDITKFKDKQIQNLPSSYLAALYKQLRELEFEPTRHAYLNGKRLTKLISDTYPGVNIWKTQVQNFMAGERNLRGEPLQRQLAIREHTSDIESEIQYTEKYLKKNILKAKNRAKLQNRLKNLKAELTSHTVGSNLTSHELLKDSITDLHLLSDEMDRNHQLKQALDTIFTDDLHKRTVEMDNNARAYYLNENPAAEASKTAEEALDEITAEKEKKEKGEGVGTEKSASEELGEITGTSMKPDEEIEQLGPEHTDVLTEAQQQSYQKNMDYIIKTERNHKGIHKWLSKVTACLTGGGK